jgi:hypothetical protein
MRSGALALAFEVCPVTGRTLAFGGEFGFEVLDACLECGDQVSHRLVTTR